MLITETPVDGKDDHYRPLHKRFRDESDERLSFCEKQEFSIKFTCMTLFALLLIAFGTLISETVRHMRDASDN